MEMISLVAIRTGPDRKTGRWSNFDERCSHGIGRLVGSGDRHGLKNPAWGDFRLIKAVADMRGLPATAPTTP
jgi:hypothetical protein